MATTDDQFVTAEGLASSLSVVGGGPVVPTAWWYGRVAFESYSADLRIASSKGVTVNATKGQEAKVTVSFETDGTYLIDLGDVSNWYSTDLDAMNEEATGAVQITKFLFDGGPGKSFSAYYNNGASPDFVMSVEKVG